MRREAFSFFRFGAPYIRDFTVRDNEPNTPSDYQVLANMLILLHETFLYHYNDVIMGTIASQITSLTIAFSTVYLDTDQRKHQSSASLAFVRGIHRRPVNSPHKWPVTRKMLPFDDVIMMTASLIHQWRNSLSMSFSSHWIRHADMKTWKLWLKMPYNMVLLIIVENERLPGHVKSCWSNVSLIMTISQEMKLWM